METLRGREAGYTKSPTAIVMVSGMKQSGMKPNHPLSERTVADQASALRFRGSLHFGMTIIIGLEDDLIFCGFAKLYGFA